MHEHIIVPAIRSREIAQTQGSGVRERQNSLQPHDFSNGLFNVHPSQYGTQGR
jgi:hypothetical protein